MGFFRALTIPVSHPKLVCRSSSSSLLFFFPLSLSNSILKNMTHFTSSPLPPHPSPITHPLIHPPTQGVIEFSLALFFNKLVSYTFLFWLPLYVKTSCELLTCVYCQQYITCTCVYCQQYIVYMLYCQQYTQCTSVYCQQYTVYMCILSTIYSVHVYTVNNIQCTCVYCHNTVYKCVYCQQYTVYM